MTRIRNTAGFRKLKQIVEDLDTVGGRRFAFFIQTLIVLSLVSFSLDTLRDLPENVRLALDVFEVASIAIFTVEYFLRVAVADSKPQFIFSFFGIIDFIAFAPFYLAAGIDLRSLRVFRLFRLVRILKLLRYSEALARFREALALMKEEIVLFFALCGVLVFVSSVGIYYFENPVQPEVFGSIFHSMWWAVATLTTVGYGDAYPVTVGGKVFTALMLVIGIGVVAVPAGLLASAFSRAARKEVGAAPGSAVRRSASGKSDPEQSPPLIDTGDSEVGRSS